MFQKPDSMETDNTVLSQIPFNSRWPMRSWKYKKKRKRNVAMSEANWRRARGEPRLIDPWRGGLVNVTQSNGSASLKCQLYPDKPSRFRGRPFNSWGEGWVISGHQEFFFLAIWWAGYFFLFFSHKPSITFVLHAIFFFRQALAGNFFSKSPTPSLKS